MAAGKPSRIVAVVDDDYRVRESLEQLFHSAGLEHVLFSSAEEALSYEEAQQIGCLVTDVRMPGMDGCELQRRIGEKLPDLAVIFLTAHQDDAVYRHARQHGAFALLYKPFDGEELLRLITLALRWNRTQEAFDVDC
ncbi:response regulator transcription factor [Terriglobus albidus]|uniref:response regulator transcription factor n=1 Tax=Terriglobus albidus TaxID=1592106 RepID=UPI0021DF8C29|nr:response regulator [Terriglobus albidus]